ncbi:hypothetical protein WEN_03330 [Mycoplasma wenyonii str. Massachusetts]|uniref:Uncharacterized protein n=1 Tax=Mycoplasma wenyonii (strain Massachusetts) TaxID=1197325 RepID=I6Z742_MYCWM|nr:hypothetical protein [Mycoplasma wenyonii]AFN65443.1 hypothetical protein WEN_03330 [Mycoplasma wenyonii str. Massachusetts]
MISVPTLSKGLITLGSLGGPSFFFSSSYLSLEGNRLIEVTNNEKNTEWQKGYITPVFDSKWLGGGFEKPTSYSYGYVARANGTNYFESEDKSRRAKRNLKEAEGELRLIEKVGDTQSSIQSKENSRNGLTPKKFFLMGVNVKTKEVEVTGLVSLVKTKHPGIKSKCQRDESMAIQNGYCDDKVFFKQYENIEDQPGFVETQLKNDKDQQVGVLEIKGGNELTAIFGNGIKKSSNVSLRHWSRSAPLQVLVSQKPQNLFVGPKTKSGKKYNRPYVVVHDLKFAEGVLRDKWKAVENNMANLIQVGMTKLSKGKISKVPFNKDRQYYLWDPSYTEIKDGTLKTKEGYKLPWKVNFSLPYTISLIK